MTGPVLRKSKMKWLMIAAMVLLSATAGCYFFDVNPFAAFRDPLPATSAVGAHNQTNADKQNRMLGKDTVTAGPEQARLSIEDRCSQAWVLLIIKLNHIISLKNQFYNT